MQLSGTLVYKGHPSVRDLPKVAGMQRLIYIDIIRWPLSSSIVISIKN